MEFKVGTRVRRIDKSWLGVVNSLRPESKYPVRVAWDSGRTSESFTLDGEYWTQGPVILQIVGKTAPAVGQIWERLEDNSFNGSKKGELISILKVTEEKVLWKNKVLPLENFINTFKFVADSKASLATATVTQVKPTIESTKGDNQMKQRNNGNFRVFDKKGNVHKEGLLFQCVKFGLTDKRPFVKELLEKEADRIINSQTVKGMLTRADKALANYNLLAAGVLIDTIAAKRYIEAPDNAGKVSIDRKANTALNILRYNKECSKKYLWIADYLTKENMNKENVVLFDSNKIKIALVNGTLCATFFKKTHNEEFVIEYSFKFPVSYNEELKQFHI